MVAGEPLDDEASLPLSRSFVVQFSRDSEPGSRYRGRVEHIDSGRSQRFASLDELAEFVGRLLADS